MRRLSLILLVGLALCGALPYATTGRVAEAKAERRSAGTAPQVFAGQLLKDVGFQIAGGELPSRSPAVAVDVDADGDKDLVANVGSLDLGVWINDGTGRLTRVRSTHAVPSWAPVPPVPTFQSDGPEPLATAPDGSPSTSPAAIRAGPVPQPASFVGLGSVSLPSRLLPVSRPTRAPPRA